MTNEQVLVPVADATRRLGIGATSFWKLVREGQLKVKKIGRRTLVEASEIARFIDALPTR